MERTELSDYGYTVWYDKEKTGSNNGNYILRVYDSETDGNFLGNFKSIDEIRREMKSGEIFESVNFMESFILDPIACMETTDPENFFEDYDAMTAKIFEEATAPTPKKNIFKKIIDFIVNICKIICNALKSFWNWLTSLFSRKVKTADQVLKDLGVKANPIPNPELTVNIPKSDDSTYEIMEKCNLMVKPLEIAMENDGKVTITTKKILQRSAIPAAQGKIKGAYLGNLNQIAHGSHIVALETITNPDIMQKLLMFADEISSRKEFVSSAEISKINATLANSKLENKKYTVTINQIKELNKCINDCMLKISKASDEIYDDEWIRHNAAAVNNLSFILATIQYGINTITSCFKQVYVIDADYKECISDKKTLSLFVEQLLSANIPYKYAAINIWLVADKSIKGDANAYKPVWGQSRVTFFPPDEKIVTKIALNQYGVKCNKTEFNLYEKVKKTAAADKLAAVTWISPNYAVEDMERIKGTRPTEPLTNKFTRELNSDLFNDFSIKVIDLHSGNILVTPSGMKTYDYGTIVHI